MKCKKPLIGTSLKLFLKWQRNGMAAGEIIKQLKIRGLDRDLCEYLGPRIELFLETMEQHSERN